MARTTRLTPAQLSRALTRGVASSYYLHGSETLLKDEALATLLDHLLDPGTRDFNLDIVSAQQVDPDQLAALCATLPMMAERRVVVLKDVEAWKRKTKAKLAAVEYLTKPAPETVVIIVQGNDDDPDKEIIAPTQPVDCAPLTGDALEEWLDNRLARLEVGLTPDAREHLLRATNGELGFLASEAAKLTGLGGSEPVDLATVEALVGIHHGETADDWRDAVLSDDVTAATAMLPRILSQSGISGVQLAILLGTSLLLMQWTRATAEARRLRGPSLANAVRSFCFEARPRVGSYGPFSELVASHAGAWPLERCRAAVRAALAADVALKSTTVSDEEGVLLDLVLSIAASRARKAA